MKKKYIIFSLAILLAGILTNHLMTQGAIYINPAQIATGTLNYVLTSGASKTTWALAGGSTGPWTRTGTNVNLTTSTDFVGIGTSTPSEALSVAGSIGFYVPNGGASSTVSACGSSPAMSVGADGGNLVTVGGGIITSCKITFGVQAKNPPICVANDDSNTALSISPQSTTSSVTLLSATTMGGDTISYACFRH